MPRYHPACLLFPQLGPQELQELADDIKTHGLRHAIVLHEGKVLDGRNRLAACKIAGVKPRYVQWKGIGSPTEWVISENLIRRHLTSSQRAVVAHDLLPLLEKEAKARQRLSQGRGIKVAKKLDTLKNGAATKVAARLFRTNHNYVQTIKSISSEAPELVDEIRSGKITVPDAKELARVSQSIRKKVLSVVGNGGPKRKVIRVIRQAQVAARINSAQQFAQKNGSNGSSRIRLYHCRFQQLQETARLRPNSAHLVLTDIPYDKTFLPQLDDLGRFAKEVLVDGGLFLTFVGQFHLDRYLQSFGKHLTYRWTLATTWGHDSNLIHPLGISSHWKPILLFSRGKYRRTSGRKSDLLHMPRKEKDLHDWQQPIGTIEDLIRNFSDPGNLVCDPCGGGFTTALACRNLSRRFVGCDSDKKCVALGQERLANGTKRKVKPR